LVLPYNHPEFYNYGTAASADLPIFVDPGDGSVPQWDPTAQACKQKQFKDFTGVDSLTAFLVSILVFVGVQYLEHLRGGKPLFTFPGLVPYEKEKEKEHGLDKTVKAGEQENSGNSDHLQEDVTGAEDKVGDSDALQDEMATE
jgi:hypothetical protein